ncbi:DUF3533 domain-containing protein [Mycena chlorophos]|uniref:DUF3533 domain-containing protein n=1 Tax=Mycena chlorophos TaxID=658473 RepID=A0A8H6SSJ2_MYCCL|nr:DUF3533 domain-containing protein [Mycena chlorophos]
MESPVTRSRSRATASMASGSGGSRWEPSQQTGVIWKPSQSKNPTYRSLQVEAEKAALRTSLSQPDLGSQPTPSNCNSEPWFGYERRTPGPSSSSSSSSSARRPPSTAHQRRHRPPRQASSLSFSYTPGPSQSSASQSTPTTTAPTQTSPNTRAHVDRLLNMRQEDFTLFMKEVAHKADLNVERAATRIGLKQQTTMTLAAGGRPASVLGMWNGKGKERERRPLVASGSGSSSSTDGDASFFCPVDTPNADSEQLYANRSLEEDADLMPPPPVPTSKAKGKMKQEVAKSSPRRPQNALAGPSNTNKLPALNLGSVGSKSERDSPASSKPSKTKDVDTITGSNSKGKAVTKRENAPKTRIAEPDSPVPAVPSPTPNREVKLHPKLIEERERRAALKANSKNTDTKPKPKSAPSPRPAVAPQPTQAHVPQVQRGPPALGMGMRRTNSGPVGNLSSQGVLTKPFKAPLLRAAKSTVETRMAPIASASTARSGSSGSGGGSGSSKGSSRMVTRDSPPYQEAVTPPPTTPASVSMGTRNRGSSSSSSGMQVDSPSPRKGNAPSSDDSMYETSNNSFDLEELDKVMQAYDEVTPMEVGSA